MWTRWTAIAFGCALVACGADDEPTESAVDDRAEPIVKTNFGDPLPNLSPQRLARFENGAEVFAEGEDVQEGLGPVFNGASCAECHFVPALGGGSTLVETRFGKVANGVFNPLENLGGSLIQTTGIGAVNGCDVPGEVVP